MLRSFWLACFSLLVFTAGVQAQHGMSRMELARLPAVTLPRQNNDSLLLSERKRRLPGRPQIFAVSLPVDVRPGRDGSWTYGADRDRWRMRVKSPGAKSLNFGFTRFALPPDAALYLSTDRDRFGPFTAADNETHAQLWTPLLRGDEVVIELDIPAGSQNAVELVLSTVNHDFEGAVDLLSDDCHLDVACGAADGYPQIEDYRDVIRSVAAYTLEGRERCTGFLVNNTNQDGRPLFLTANHCGVDAATAPTLVAYWNFENDRCRPPGSVASGGEGNGRLDVFNTGARLLARYAATDMTLVELDEPVNPRARAFYAGWDARSGLPRGEMATVHHPNLDEKRISFTEQALARSTIVGEADANGNFLRVPGWDLGSTEGGSSGAPLFDASGRVRGQLFGGRASCSNGGEDMFGWLYVSWTGGDTPDSGLRDWLDPCGLSDGVLNGLDASDLKRRLTANRGCGTVCRDGQLTFEFTLGGAFPPATNLRVITDNGLLVEAPTQVDGGATFTVTVAATDPLSPATYPLTLEATGGGLRHATTVYFTNIVAAPARVAALRPADRGGEIDPFVEMTWRSVAGADAYDLQYSLTTDFDAVAANLDGLTDTVYTPDYPLAGNTTYFWRVRASNACGNGAWSAVRSFTTQTRTCLLTRGQALPVPIPAANPTEVIARLEVTEDIVPADLEVILGIEHTYIGDLAVKLISPGGTEIALFDPLENGSCPARNLYVVFTDDAALTAETFADRCEDGSAREYIRARPLGSLSDLTGQSARGTWQLVVDDQAAMDGGAITDFRLRLCENRADARDLGVEVASAAIEACSNTGGTATLRVGSDFTEPLSLVVEAGSLPLDNYTYTFDPVTRTVDVRFSAWTFAGAGAQELTFTVVNGDGTEGRAVNTLTVFPLPEPVTPLPAAFTPDRVTFRWRGSDAAETYLLELAPTADFDRILTSAVTGGRQLSLPRSGLPAAFYWRVSGVNGCGSFPGPARPITADTANAVHPVNPEQSIAIYPNPTREAVTVELRGTWSDTRLTAVLLGADGREFARWEELNRQRNRLELDRVPPGVYFLRVSGRFGQVTERLLRLR